MLIKLKDFCWVPYLFIMFGNDVRKELSPLKYQAMTILPVCRLASRLYMGGANLTPLKVFHRGLWQNTCTSTVPVLHRLPSFARILSDQRLGCYVLIGWPC